MSKPLTISELIIPFLIGGTIVSSIKYTASHLNNTKLAAMIGGFPLGLFSIYYLSQMEAANYGVSYFIITSILLFSVLVFNIAMKYFALPKTTAWIISLFTWFILAGIRYVL